MFSGEQRTILESGFLRGFGSSSEQPNNYWLSPGKCLVDGEECGHLCGIISFICLGVMAS